ncbi:HK97 family phage prohead protease [Rathayibacter sp. AY1C5]|uniref:HK97 family phage prohead protease n=1 Tax=Rathayibacter sp. AY1C5 TaxID=2080538 RepID=UPI000CE860F3|nr:HK97 family phage prohead protease [Rathayibacter sp. AY1C5]PPG60266.1 hypothetical protein C5C57_05550 [Rathayibacter sp. AY1C5]
MKTQLNKKINKLFNISLKSINDEERTVQFVFSDDSVDRYGEKVDQKTWDITHYKNNPVVLWGHDPSEPQNILGRAVDIQLDQSGKSLLTAQFDTAEVNPKADLIFRQVKAGTLRTVSAGFIPHSMEFEDDVPVLKDNELLEVSVVAIPANRNALALSYKSGGLDTKDASFLIKSMRDEADAIEAQVTKDASDDDDDNELTKLTQQIALLTETVTALTTQVAELKPADSDDAGDGGDDDASKGDADDSAKDGDDDQSGAEEDEIDLETDLTDDQIAALEAELAENE